MSGSVGKIAGIKVVKEYSKWEQRIRQAANDLGVVVTIRKSGDREIEVDGEAATVTDIYFVDTKMAQNYPILPPKP